VRPLLVTQLSLQDPRWPLSDPPSCCVGLASRKPPKIIPSASLMESSPADERTWPIPRHWFKTPCPRLAARSAAAGAERRWRQLRSDSGCVDSFATAAAAASATAGERVAPQQAAGSGGLLWRGRPRRIRAVVRRYPCCTLSMSRRSRCRDRGRQRRSDSGSVESFATAAAAASATAGERVAPRQAAGSGGLLCRGRPRRIRAVVRRCPLLHALACAGGARCRDRGRQTRSDSGSVDSFATAAAAASATAGSSLTVAPSKRLEARGFFGGAGPD